MRTLLISILTIMAAMTGNAQNPASKGSQQKSLIVFFSRSGNNYLGGEIVNLKVGNTHVVAEKIQKMTGADIFRIEPSEAYPVDYTQCTVVAKKELADNARPRFNGSVDNMTDYDVIYLGYPNWWGTMPMVVFSFLEKYDLAGKTIMPFCTNEGSGMGRSEQDIKRLCPDSSVKKGLAIRGGNVSASDGVVAKWIENNK